jgi:alpha-maltose-1-phosphate synthase
VVIASVFHEPQNKMKPATSLKIGIASTGRFHMFDLARQLSALGQETRLFTGYPRFKVDGDLRAIAQVRSRWLLFEQAWRRLPVKSPAWVRVRMFEDFGRWLERSLARDTLDVLDALEGSGLEAGRTVRDAGGVWICNRGSSHVLAQKRVLEQEYRRWGFSMPGHFFPPAYVDRCLAEYEGADAIVVGSTFSQRTFVSQGLPPSKIHVCPYGVDLSLFRPERKRDGRFRVLFVGTQSLRKGVGYLFDAVRPLVKNGSIELWLIGHRQPETRQLLDRNADLFVHHGARTRAELSWYYSQGSVLVLPSVEEGLALVQAQAMACGVPVIATPNTGAEDLFSDGLEGLLVPARSPVAIRRAIQRMLDTPAQRDEMAAAALRRVTQLGGWDAYGRRCLQVYRGVLDSKQSGRATALSPTLALPIAS